MKKRFLAVVVGVVLAAGAAITLAGCASDADTVNQNISTDAEQFKVQRQFVFYNSITNTYIASVTGKCSVDAADLSQTITFTCKVGKDKYIKDYFKNADNVTWFLLQSKPVAESNYNFHIVLKPSAVIPNLEVETSPNNQDDSIGGDSTTTITDPNQPVAPNLPPITSPSPSPTGK